MIISHGKKFIFIHNYKVAGTSMKKALKKYNHPTFLRSTTSAKLNFILGKYPWVFTNQFPPPDGHIMAKDLKSRIADNIFENYYKFGFTRNPWDWQVSLYKYMLKKESHFQHELAKSFNGFNDYLDWRLNEDLHLQKEFFYDEQGNCLMDFIGKMENLNDDFTKICEKLQLNASLPHLNASRNENDSYLKYYDDQKKIDMVAEAFKVDIETFDYKIPQLKR